MTFNNLVFFIPTILELQKTLNIDDIKKEHPFIYATYRGTPFIVTGIGKSAAAAISAIFHTKYKPNTSVLTGICGAYKGSGLNIGDIVSIKYDYLADEAVYDGTSITTMHEKNFSPAPENRGEFAVWDDYMEINSNTVSLIPYYDDLSEQYRKKTAAKAENMEGAAFALAANIMEIKPYHIRSVSNFCGDINTQKWDTKKALKSLKKAIDEIISKHS